MSNTRKCLLVKAQSWSCETLLYTWGEAEKGRNGSLGPEGHQQKTTCSFWIFCLCLLRPADNKPAVSESSPILPLEFFPCCTFIHLPNSGSKLLAGMASSCCTQLALLHFSNFYGTIPVYKSRISELIVCMCKGVYHSEILAAWL